VELGFVEVVALGSSWESEKLFLKGKGREK